MRKSFLLCREQGLRDWHCFVTVLDSVRFGSVVEEVVVRQSVHGIVRPLTASSLSRLRFLFREAPLRHKVFSAYSFGYGTRSSFSDRFTTPGGVLNG